MLLAAAQVNCSVVAILDMEPDGFFVKLAAGVEVDDVKHDVAGPDDVERRIEDVLRDGHAVEVLLRFVVVSVVIASEAQQSSFWIGRTGLLRRKCSSQ
jgi:hypothetical protein